MALPEADADREYGKFRDGSGGPSIAVTRSDGTEIGSSGAVSMTDDAAFTPGSSSVNPIGAICDETGTDSVDEGDVGAVRMTADRKMIVTMGGGTPTAGTTSLTTTASIQLHAGTACKELVVQNDPDNSVDVLVGDSSSQVFQIIPGQSIVLPVSNVNLVYAKNVTSTTQPVNWISIN